jgi:site-specific DNA recombinase
VAEIKNVFAYLRVSSKSQAKSKKHGFTRQIKDIEAFCKERGYAIEDVFRDDVSGTNDENERPAFESMITRILANGVNTVVVEGLDRLARELMVQEQIFVYLASKNITLMSASTGENITEAIKGHPMKKAQVQMQGVFSELDKNQLVRKLRLAREKVKAEKGKCGGRKHYGEESEEERQIIKRITYMRRKSKYQEKRMSFQKIANTLNEEGIKTRLDKNWTATGIKNVIDKNWITRK